MSKCISVALSDGQVVSVNVDSGVDSLPKSDTEILEEWMKSIKARRL